VSPPHQANAADTVARSLTELVGIRCRWGIRNGSCDRSSLKIYQKHIILIRKLALFYVAKDPSSDEPEKVLGIACWLPPKSAELSETWREWLEGWRLWVNQVGMNLWYGRGGLNVKVSLVCFIDVLKTIIGTPTTRRPCYRESSVHLDRPMA
jgi:hypothetical protein